MAGNTCPNCHQFVWTEVFDVSLQNLDNVFEPDEIDQVQLANGCYEFDELFQTQIKDLDVLNDVFQLPQKEGSLTFAREALPQVCAEFPYHGNLLLNRELILVTIHLDLLALHLFPRLRIARPPHPRIQFVLHNPKLLNILSQGVSLLSGQRPVPVWRSSTPVMDQDGAASGDGL